MTGFGYMLPMKKPTFKPVYFEGRADPWAITIPAYLSPTGKIQRRFFLRQREAKEFGSHMKRQFEDLERNSTYLSRDRLTQAAKAYDVITEVSGDTGKTSR